VYRKTTPVNQVYSLAAFSLFSLLCFGSGCEKKPAHATDPGAVNALENAIGSQAGDPAVDTSPLPGIATDKLDGEKPRLFFSLIGSLASPCGKAHSLRVSFTTDTACKRAPFAVRYVLALVDDEATEMQIRDEYRKRYAAKPATVKIDGSRAPREGTDGAPIKIYEFFDYGCPHCALLKPVLEQVMAERAGKVVEYFMMFPLDKHEHSKSAARAALAAAQQGKFRPMHDILFAKAPQHDRERVFEYAKSISLDMGKFEAAYNDPATLAQVKSDLAQGEQAGVESTPTLYFNDRKYDGPLHLKYIEMWIDEELAVNR
jgi:protein-disulfide isomerase